MSSNYQDGAGFGEDGASGSGSSSFTKRPRGDGNEDEARPAKTNRHSPSNVSVNVRMRVCTCVRVHECVPYAHSVARLLTYSRSSAYCIHAYAHTRIYTRATHTHRRQTRALLSPRNPRHLLRMQQVVAPQQRGHPWHPLRYLQRFRFRRSSDRAVETGVGALAMWRGTCHMQLWRNRSVSIWICTNHQSRTPGVCTGVGAWSWAGGIGMRTHCQWSYQGSYQGTW